jgi:hypothetical protein
VHYINPREDFGTNVRPSGTSEEVTNVGPLGISKLNLEQVSTLVKNVDFLVPHLELLYGLLEQPCPGSWQLADKGAGSWRMEALKSVFLTDK